MDEYIIDNIIELAEEIQQAEYRASFLTTLEELQYYVNYVCLSPWISIRSRWDRVPLMYTAHLLQLDGTLKIIYREPLALSPDYTERILE